MISFRTFTLCLAFILIFLNQGIGQKKTFHCRKTEQIIRIIQENHIEARPLDREFNNKVNTAFISTLDPLGIFFTREDVDYIKAYCPDLVNLECSENKNFMGYILEIFRARVEESNHIISDILSNPINFDQGDTLFIPKADKIIYPNDIEELEENLGQYIRFQLLKYFVSAYKLGDSSLIRNEENLIASLEDLKAGIRQREECKINHLLNYPGGFEEYIFSIYLNVLTSTFDPHTNYFSMNDKEQFESSISRNKNSFGADLDQNDKGEIIIARLIPGGPAWRSGELNTGDVLLSLKFPDKVPMDLICSNLQEIQDLIYNSGSDRLEITVRSSLGQVKTIELKIESLTSAENAVYSFILEGEKKIGYVSLPGFYTEPNQNDPLGCASDMVNEILKLESDGMEGLILDVRNNGGGSIIEAVDLAGVFLDAGPLCIYTNRYQKPTLIKDLGRGTLYDGPLIMLVNGYSASASEILAGVLQDYKRALIVGTPTFGKASGQVILPLSEPGTDEASMFFYGFDPTDFIKITTTRYYRLNGTSHQSRGMNPDIQLPQHAGYSKIKESEYPSAFKNDTIHKDVTFEPFQSFPLERLVQASEERVRKNSTFIAFNALNDSIRPLYQGQLFIPLDFENFNHDYKRNYGFFNQFDELEASPDKYYNIINNSLNQKILEMDVYKDEIHQEIIENLAKDFYLEEAYLIMHDLLNQPEKE